MSEHELCDTCRFYDASSSYGECRRHPPIADPSGFYAMFGKDEDESPYAALQGFFPRVDTDAWCGEWKPYPLPVVEAVSGKINPPR